MTSKALQNVEVLNNVSGEVDPGTNGFFPNNSDAKILRLRDRLFINEGAAFTGNLSGTQGGFVPTSTEGANWGPRDSSLLVAQDIGLMGITAFVSNDNMNLAGGQPTESIAISGFTINNQATRTTWCGYFDIQHEAGVASYGIEIAAKNKGSNLTDTPYLTQGGVYGTMAAGGGDATYGGAATNPSNTAFLVKKNGTTWNKGLVFMSDSLTGSDGTTGTATAIEMGYGQKIAWRAPGNYAAFEINAQVSTAGANSSMLVGNNFIRFRGSAQAVLCQLSHNTNAVNYFNIENRATGLAPRITATGTDTNIDLIFATKGTGVVVFGTRSALGAETLTGYITIKDAGGTLRKLAVIS